MQLVTLHDADPHAIPGNKQLADMYRHAPSSCLVLTGHADCSMHRCAGCSVSTPAESGVELRTGVFLLQLCSVLCSQSCSRAEIPRLQIICRWLPVQGCAGSGG